MPPATASTPAALLEAGGEVARTVLRPWAGDVDADDRFPTESVAALRDAGLLGYFVPKRYGGSEGDLATFVELAAVLGEDCLSTAVIWGMHCQQVAVLARHAAETHGHVLESVARDGALVASVTTERGKGGDLLTAEAPLERDGDGLIVRREAPIVSYGTEADYFAITMRADESSAPTDARLVVVKRSDGQVRTVGEWAAMGMRGTRSAPMEFDVRVPANRVVPGPFRQIALETMVPVGHLAWSAAWFGAARGAYRKLAGSLRELGARGSVDLRSDLLLSRLASIRLELDQMEALLGRVRAEVVSVWADRSGESRYEDITFNIRVNNLKVGTSRASFRVADQLVEIAGLRRGYLQGTRDGLERVFRDLRSAELMFHNDRLLASNGRLILVENTPIRSIWSAQEPRPGASHTTGRGPGKTSA